MPAVLTSAVLVYAASTLGAALLTGMVAALAAFAVAVTWLVRTVACAVTARRFFARMLTVPLVFGATLSLLAVDAPARVRFALARPAFDRAVQSIIAGGAAPEQFVRRLGTYAVESVERRGENIYFRIGDAGFLGGAGFAHLADGPPDPPVRFGENDSVRPLAPPWYEFTYSV